MVPAGLPNHKLVSEREEVHGASTPALRSLQGKQPLVHAVRSPWSEDSRPLAAAFELAVFDDGTVAYEGDLCGSDGSLVVTRLERPSFERLRGLVARSCVGFTVQSATHVCTHSGLLSATCAEGGRVVQGEDRCGGRFDPGGKLDTFLNDLLREVDITSKCDKALKGVAAGEISRTLQAERTRIWIYAPR
jgi:hypothetical protein